MSGSTQVTQTAHWTAIIGTIAVSICLIIGMVALGLVVIRDGNTSLVANAESIFGNILTGLAVTLGLLVAGPQAVSAFIGRFQNVIAGAAPVAPPAPANTTETSAQPPAA